MINFKKNLYYFRFKKSMTLAMIAKELDFSASQWSNYEQGLSYPKFLDLIKISKYFEISETDLIHKDLQASGLLNINTEITKVENNASQEILIIQNKLIKMQEEKIDELQKEIVKLKALDITKSE